MSNNYGVNENIARQGTVDAQMARDEQELMARRRQEVDSNTSKAVWWVISAIVLIVAIVALAIWLWTEVPWVAETVQTNYTVNDVDSAANSVNEP